MTDDALVTAFTDMKIFFKEKNEQTTSTSPVLDDALIAGCCRFLGREINQLLISPSFSLTHFSPFLLHKRSGSSASTFLSLPLFPLPSSSSQDCNFSTVCRLVFEARVVYAEGR